MAEVLSIQIERFMGSNQCLLQVHTMADYIHQSWKLPDGKVLSFENIPDNYPSGSFHVWDDIDEYIEAIADISWLNDHYEIIHHSLGEYGFPFAEEEDDENETLVQAPPWGSENI